MSLGTRLAAPFEQVPNAHLSDAIAVLAPVTLSRTVSFERAVLVSEVGYGTEASPCPPAEA